MSKTGQMAVITSVVCALAALASGVVQAAAQLNVPERTYDAGDVEVGKVFDHDFVFENKGDAVIHITEVKPTCSCTVPEYPTEIAPGAQGKIKVRINTEHLEPKKLSKTVTVTTDAPGGERTVLEVRFNLTTPLEFQPNGNVYLYTRLGEAKQTQVLVRPHRPGMKVSNVASNNPAIQVSLAPVKVVPPKGGEGALVSQLLPREGDYWLTIKLAASAPAGLQRADVTVKTTDPAFPQAIVKVNAKVDNDAEAKPAPPTDAKK